MISTKASAVIGPTPGCVISRSTSGRFLASCSIAAVSSSIVGFIRSSSSSRSFRRLTGPGSERKLFQLCSPCFAPQLFLPVASLRSSPGPAADS